MKIKTNQKTKGLKAIAVMAIAVVGSFLTAGSAKAVLSATGDFSISGTNHLILTLTNTSQDDANVPTEILTAFFFNIALNPTLTPTSAVLGGTSIVIGDNDPVINGQPAGGVVGGEWALGQNIAALNPFGASYGVSSAGFSTGAFGQPNFPGDDLSPPTAINGVNYGIAPAGYTAAGDVGGLTNAGGLIKNSVVFDLGTFAGSLADITPIAFQYGTQFGETSITVPDGGMTVQLLGAAFVGLGMVRRFFFKH
jgi:hypothetical protein